jgi:hypothetical protein
MGFNPDTSAGPPMTSHPEAWNKALAVVTHINQWIFNKAEYNPGAATFQG